MFSSYQSDIELYELQVTNGQIQTNDVVFSNTEQQDSLLINKQTELYGHNLKNYLFLKYQIWDGSFEPQTNMLQNIFIAIY